jgi:hypothetical protein
MQLWLKKKPESQEVQFVAASEQVLQAELQLWQFTLV